MKAQNHIYDNQWIIKRIEKSRWKIELQTYFLALVSSDEYKELQDSVLTIEVST